MMNLIKKILQQGQVSETSDYARSVRLTVEIGELWLPVLLKTQKFFGLKSTQ